MSTRVTLVNGSGNELGTADDPLNVEGTLSTTPSGTQDVNQTQVNGVAVSTGSGVLGTGTQRVVLATDQPAIPTITTVGTVTNLTQMSGASISMGSGVMGTGTQRVAIASDNDAVTVKQATGTNLHMVVDSGTITTVSAVTAISNALPAGTNAIGKLAANNGVDIGDVDVTSVPRSLSGPGQPGTAIDSYGHVAINLTTGNDQVLVSSAASKQIWVYGYAFTVGDAAGQTVSLQDEDNTAVTGIMEFQQYGGISVPPSGNFSMPLFKLGTDKDLEVDITGGDVDGWLCYAIVSV